LYVLLDEIIDKIGVLTALLISLEEESYGSMNEQHGDEFRND
jgi:hypothetical protein